MILFDLLKEFLSNKEYKKEHLGPRGYGGVSFFVRSIPKFSFIVDHFLDSKSDMDLEDNLSFRVRDYIIVLDGNRSTVGIWDFSNITFFLEIADILENELDYNILKYGKILLTQIRN